MNMTKEEIELYQSLNKNFRSRGMEMVCWYYVNYIKVTGTCEGYWRMLFTEIQNHPEEVNVKIDEEDDVVVIEYLDTDYDNFERYNCSFPRKYLWDNEGWKKYVAEKTEAELASLKETKRLMEEAKKKIELQELAKTEEEERALCLELMKKYGYGEPENGKK